MKRDVYGGFIVMMALALLSGCAAKKDTTRPVLPPEIVKVPIEVIVPVPAKYLQPCLWRREGKPSQTFEINAERKLCLEKYEADREAIIKIQGKPVP